MVRFDLTARACSLVGWEYQRVGALDEVLRANLRWLAGYRHRRCLDPEVEHRLCAASQGPVGLQELAEAVGHRNRRHEGQIDLAEQPEILRAQVRHRRLVRRYGRRAVGEAVNTACWIVALEDDKEVFTWVDRSRAFERRMQTFFDSFPSDKISVFCLEAAHYPDIVTLATFLASPYWHWVMVETPVSEMLLFFKGLHRLGITRTGLPAAATTIHRWLEQQTTPGTPPIPYWVLNELKYWPPGRTHWARDYVELDHDPTPDEWIRLLRDLLDRVFDL